MEITNVLDWLGPTNCEECRWHGTTVLGGKQQLICTPHRVQLQAMFDEHPERIVFWSSKWATRQYGWVEQVAESKDALSPPGDLDPEGLNRSKRTIHDYYIPYQGLRRLHALRSQYHGSWRQVAPLDPDWSPHDLSSLS